MFGYIGTISYLLLKRYSSSLAMIKPKILVTGATGKTGGAVVTELLAKGWPVRAAVRVHHARSDRLQRRGAEIVVVDIFDPIDRMFAALPSIAHTAVTPGFFADSPFLQMMPIAAHLEILPLPVAGESRNAPPSVDDIARVAVAALLDPARHAGKSYRPTGPKLVARRHAALPESRQSLRVRLAVLARFLTVPILPGFNPETYDRAQEQPMPPTRHLALDDADWAASHGIEDLVVEGGTLKEAHA